MKRVLVVDDSPIVQAMLKQILTSLGNCSIVSLKHGQEALQNIEKNGEPDLILLDVNMPVMDGLECLDELRARGITARVPVVMVTTEGEESDIQRGLQGGAVAYVKKPFQPTELRNGIQKILEAGRPVCS